MVDSKHPSDELGAFCQAARDDARLAVVRACKVLDTPSEEAFDNLAKLAARVCGSPIGAITILDAERQWFKARVGLAAEQTGLASSLCVRTLRGLGTFVVEDACGDERVATNEAVTGLLALRAYAGVAIEVDGQRVGACCAFDHRARPWTAEHIEVLRMLAQQAGALLAARITAGELLIAQNAARLVMDAQTEMLARLDANLRITVANAPLCKHLGVAKEKLLGRSVLDFSPSSEHGSLRTHFEEIRASRSARTTEQTIVCDDGRVTTHRWTDSPLLDADGKVTGFQSWGWDISDLRAREHALQAAHAGLIKANEELTVRNAEVLQLTYALTHDLQTPLATMTGQLSLLEQALRSGQPAIKPLGRLRSSVDRLTRMLTDLMAYARAGHELPRREPVDLAAIARSVVEELTPLAAEKQVLLGFDEFASTQGSAKLLGAIVIGDRDALRRSVTNLVGNAIKYTAQREIGEKRVIVRAMESEQRVRLCVADTGPGVAPALLEEVFLPFKRVSKDASGTGLGLSIVKKYIEMFDGRVWLESDGKTGTTAVVEFQRQSLGARAA